MEIINIQYPHSCHRSDRIPASVAFGNFDGVHVGHQQVINQAIHVAKEKEIQAGVMTFHPHPLEVLAKVDHPSYLTPLEDKLDLLEGLGVDFVIVVEFTRDFAKLLPEQFIQNYILDLNIKHVVAGFDFTFGHRGQGTVELLKQWGAESNDFTVDILSSVDQGNMKISSSRVRSLLQEGNVQEVQVLLNRFYQVKGTVIHGEKRGRTIGFPTANLSLTYPYVLPKQGVYAVYIHVQGARFSGVCNIGKKPTFHTENQLFVEAHIFDFEGDLYEQEITLEFVSYLRAEQKFNSLQELVDQIHSDVKKAKTIL